MGAYRNKWFKLLKEQHIAEWQVMQHGQAITIKVPADGDYEKAKADFQHILTRLKLNVTEPKEWLKFILYNSKFWYQYIVE